MSNNRIKYIDVAKGIGIISVILVHTNIPHPLLKYLLSFNMPLFFVLSGLTFSTRYNFKDFLKKKFQTLLIPYFSFSVIFYLFWAICERPLGRGEDINILKPLIGIFYANNIDGWMIYNGVMWFIPALFISELIFFGLVKLKLSNKRFITILFLLSLIAFAISKYIAILFPFGVNISLTATVFIGIGYIMKDTLVPSFSTIISIFIFIMSYLLSQLNSIVFMYQNNYGNYILFYLTAIMGIVLYLNISKKLSKSEFLNFFGRNTLIILVFHSKIIFILDIIIKKVLNLSILYSGAIITPLTIIILIPFILIINKYFSFLLAKKKSNNLINHPS